MSPLLIAALRVVTLGLTLQRDGVPDEIRDAFNELRAQLTPNLPAPPNGVEWTDADLLALAVEHNAITAEIRARHSA